MRGSFIARKSEVGLAEPGGLSSAAAGRKANRSARPSGGVSSSSVNLPHRAVSDAKKVPFSGDYKDMLRTRSGKLSSAAE
jgi:hypothetical protein